MTTHLKGKTVFRSGDVGAVIIARITEDPNIPVTLRPRSILLLDAPPLLLASGVRASCD